MYSMDLQFTKMEEKNYMSLSTTGEASQALRLNFHQLYAAVEALEVFHRRLLDLDRADGGWRIRLRLEPAAGCCTGRL